jgi:membrane protein YdbS with pleckstrin-like domain
MKPLKQDQSPEPVISAPADQGEPDLYWAGPSGWALIPHALIGVPLTALLMLGEPVVAHWLGFGSHSVAATLFVLALLFWGVVGLVCVYRGACFVYRLTPTHLYTDYGMFFSPQLPVKVRSVKRVETRSRGLNNYFHLGTVLIYLEDGEPLRFDNILHPEAFAVAIEKARREMKGTS